MIKNSVQELENFLAGDSVSASTTLIERLDAMGIRYEKEGGQLRLAESLELLDPATILSYAGTAELRLEVYRQIESTNDMVLKTLTAEEPFACIAEMQTAGKGRRGRQWISPFGRNIYLTLGRYLGGPMSRLEGLSLVVGMQVVDVLRTLGVNGIGLKWPNDLLLDDGKMGGILVEIQSPGASGIGVVAGVGINLALDEDEATAIDQPWSAAAGSASVSRNELAGRMIRSLLAAIDVFDQSGFEAFAPLWNEYNVYTDQTITVIRGDERISGVDRGVDGNGNLLLEVEGSVQVHNAGEVSMRPVSPL